MAIIKLSPVLNGAMVSRALSPEGPRFNWSGGIVKKGGGFIIRVPGRCRPGLVPAVALDAAGDYADVWGDGSFSDVMDARDRLFALLRK